MINTKIRIDLAQGIIEAEGSEDFVRTIYTDFQTSLTESHAKPNFKMPLKPQTRRAVKAKPSSTGGKGKRANTARGTPSIVKDLDLSGGGKKKNLRDFYNQYKPTSNYEKNLIFVYYMANEISVAGISANHVYTCYRNVPGTKAPVALHQSLIDTSNNKGWLDTSSTEDIKVTVSGINYLEHDMPKAIVE